MLGMLVADPDGTAPASILSVDMKAVVGPARALRAHRRRALPQRPEGRRGEQGRGARCTPTAGRPRSPPSASCVLPAGAATSGTLSVYPAAVGPAPGPEDGPIDARRGLSRGSTDDRQTVAQRVAAVEALPTNDQLAVVVHARRAGRTSSEPVKTTLTVSGSYVTGSIQRRTGELRLRVTPASVPYKGAFVVSGALAETAGETTVDLYRRDAGSRRRRSRSRPSPPRPNGRGGAVFSQRLNGWTGNAQVVAEWGGDAVALGTSARAAVVVRQAVALRAGRTSVARGVRRQAHGRRAAGQARPARAVRAQDRRRVDVLLKAVKLGADRHGRPHLEAAAGRLDACARASPPRRPTVPPARHPSRSRRRGAERESTAADRGHLTRRRLTAVFF